MGKNLKLAGAIAAAAVVASGASAFTATSTIDKANKLVGATGQTISGVNVTDVSYGYDDSGTDATSAVSFHTREVLGSNDRLTVSLTSGGEGAQPTNGSCARTVTQVGTDWTCTWETPVTDAQQLSIVVN